MLSAVGSIASQVHVADVGWVDLVVDGWLVVEFDGFSTHRAGFREDRRRDAELTRRGFVVLRFTYPDVLHRANWLVQVVRDTLVRGRPPFAQLHDADDFAGPDRGTPRWKAS
jgi:very-short-patch-repair endonuclease